MGEDLPAVGLALARDLLGGRSRLTTHWRPNFCAASPHEIGFFTAAVWIETLSGACQQGGPGWSSTARTPPPTGERHEAGFRVRLHHVEEDAARPRGSRNVEEAEFVGAGGVVGLGGLDRIAASRRSTNCTPFTTRPSFTSRQGMRRTFSMMISAFRRHAPRTA
jgi:hypothetical protein